MKKIAVNKVFFSFFILVLITCTNSAADKKQKVTNYKISSDFLKAPEKSIDFVIKTAEFWKMPYDSEYGGFFTNVERDGSPVKGETLKTILTQSRNAYGFTKAYILTGNEEYLKYARYALDFMYKYGWDKKNQGFHTCMDKQGNSIDFSADYPSNKEKWSFMQHYALLGIAAMYGATCNSIDYEFLIKGRNVIDEKLWDDNPPYKGYYETADYDWSNPRDKGFTPTMDCVTTHGLSLYLITGEEKYKTRLLELGDNIIDHIIPSMDERKLGFAEKYDSQWNAKEDSFLFIGHVLKTAWCLDRIYLIKKNSEYLEGAQKLLQEIQDKAWDSENGSPYSSGDSISGKLLNQSKDWWTIEQAINAGLINYYITGNGFYLKMADQAIDFFTKNIIDWEYGGAFAATDHTGKTKLSTLKGDYWKAGYHTIETGYYIYTYGNLYIHKKPVKLFYMIEKSNNERNIKLTPIAIEDSKLIIKSVKLDGEEYTNFDSKKRILSIISGNGGEFEVEFAVAE